MKKILFATAAIMAAMTACNKEEANVVETPAASEAKVWVEFTAGVATKAALVEGDGTHSIVWEENDAISVNGETISTTESGAKVTFAGEVDDDFLAAENYSAVYPASAGEDFNEITVKAEQTAVAEGFDDIVAVAYSADRSLQFKHVTSLIKFQVPSDFTVNTVTFSADEDLAGKVSVAMSAEDATPTITAVKEGVNTVTLTGSFEAGKDYYVAVLPGEKTNLTVRFNGYLSKNWTSTVNIQQGHVANANVLPAPERFTWGVVGQHQGWDITKPTPMYKVTDNVYAVLDITLKHNGFKFAKHGLQNWNTANTSFGAWKDFAEPYVVTDWYQVYTNNLGDQNKNLGVSDWSKKYDVYVKVMTNAAWGQELKYNVVVAGSKVTFPQ